MCDATSGVAGMGMNMGKVDKERKYSMISMH
jgi:hypothetical protein